MLVFGEIISFESPVPDDSIDSSSSVVVIVSTPEGGLEATNVTKGVVTTDAYGRRKRVFPFNRPFTRDDVSMLVLQVIQVYATGAQSLVGYGSCQLEVESGSSSQEFLMPLWRPRSGTEFQNKQRGAFTPFADMQAVVLSPGMDGGKWQTVSSQGKVRVRIQRIAYR